MANQPGMGGAYNQIPLEVTRLRGNPGHKKLPDVRTTQALLSAEDVDMLSEVPAQLQPIGASLWRYAWSAGASWISPQTDAAAVTMLCEITDFAQLMRAKFIQTGEICYSREYIAATDKQISLLRELGLTPAARSKLGVAEVKSKSRLEQLRLDREREERKRNGER
jgi:phage terminase small subunit